MKLSINENISYNDLKDLIRSGAKFISYQYIISVPIFYPTKRFSKLYFLLKAENLSKHSLKYNLLNILLGFWGLPFGPTVMYQSIRTNLKGGIDFTEDVMVNLTEQSFLDRNVIMQKPARYFVEPSKSNKKELTKVVKRLRDNNIIKGEIIIGFYINTDKDEKPYHVVGIKAKLNDELISLINNEIYKRFYTHSKFEIVSLEDNSYENLSRLKTEGYCIN